MKKLILILLGSLIFFSCSPNREERTKREIEKNEEIIAMFKSKYPEDNFYFIQGLDYEKDKNTNIRYRGILYSDRLEKLDYPFGLEMALEGGSDGSSYLENYEALFWQLEIDKPIEEKMKEIFGELSILNNNNSMTKAKYEHLKSIRGKNIPFEEKNGALYTIVNVFVDRLEDIDKEEMKKKTYKFAKFLYDDINLVTYLQVYIRDNTFFEDYNLVAYQVYPPFREREDIKKILEKIKAKEKISKDEKIALVNVFYKNFTFKKIPYLPIRIMFDKKELKDFNNQKINVGKITIREQ